MLSSFLGSSGDVVQVSEDDARDIMENVSHGPLECCTCIFESERHDTMLEKGQTQGSVLTTHQQSLTTGPFGNTCKADAVSLEVAVGGFRTHVSTTRGNAKWIQSNSNTTARYHLPT
jgi:hypothetical protein